MGKLSEARFETYLRHITKKMDGRRLDKKRKDEWTTGRAEDDIGMDGLVRNKTTIAEGKRLHKEFMANFPKNQFERALSKVVEGKGTPEDVNYVVGHASDFGQTENIARSKGISVVIFDRDINF